MNTSCSSSSAVHNTQADFSRWGLWEKNDKSVGRGVYGSCAFFAELWAYFLPPYERAGRAIPAKVPGAGISREEYSNEREENT